MPLPFCFAVADYPDLDVRQALASAGPIDQVATGLQHCQQEATGIPRFM